MQNLSIDDLPAKHRRHTPPDMVVTVQWDGTGGGKDATVPVTWVVMGKCSLGAFPTYNDALLAVAQTIHEKPHKMWENFRIEGHTPSWTVGEPDFVRAFKRDGTAYIPDTYSEETRQYRRSSRLHA